MEDAQNGLDQENRAFLMTVAMQRWLAIRLDLFGDILVLGICLFGAATAKSINPAKTSVVLTYTLGSEFNLQISHRVIDNGISHPDLRFVE